MKKCSKCQVEKPDSFFAATGDGRLRGHCKECRAKDQMRRKLARKERDAAAARKEAQRNSLESRAKAGIALPRTYVSTEPWVPQDNSFYRNDGNKHIQSRGV